MVEYVPKLSAQVSVSEIVTPGCVVGSTIGKHIKDKGREVRGGGFPGYQLHQSLAKLYSDTVRYYDGYSCLRSLIIDHGTNHNMERMKNKIMEVIYS